MHILQTTLLLCFSISCLSAQELNLTWALTFGGELEDEAFSIHYDKEDNIYISGEFNGEVDFDPGPGTHILNEEGGAGDAFLLKLDKNGKFLWVFSLGNYADDQGNSIAFDEENNVYWAGVFQKTVDFDPGPSEVKRTSNGAWDAFILKLTSEGEFVWVHVFGSSSSDYLSRISIDSENNLFVTGDFGFNIDFDPGPNEVILNGNVTVLKYSSDKTFIWGKTIKTTGRMYTRDLVADNEGNIYIVGEFSGDADFDPGSGVFKIRSKNRSFDAFVLKLSKQGEFEWVNSFGGSSIDRAEGIDVDQNNNVYVSGHFRETVVFNLEDSIVLKSRRETDGYTTKISSDGWVQWVSPIRGYGNIYSYDISHNKIDQIFIVGNFGGTADFDPSEEEFNIKSNGHQDLYLLVLNDDGQFINVMNFGGSSFDISRSVQSKPNGEIIFVGEYKYYVEFGLGADTLEFLSNGDDDIVITKLNGEMISSNDFEEERKNITVFPNPAADYVYLPTKIENERIIKVEAYSLDGKRIKIFYNDINIGYFRMPLHGLSGLVVLKIFTENNVFSSKLISLGG